MIGWRRTTPCERAAQWISLELDGELTELERAGLTRHVARCADCRVLAAELGGLTALLRATPLVEPTGELPMGAPRRRARARKRIGLALAFAGILAALASFVTTRSTPELLGGSPRALAFADRQQQIRFVHDKYLQMEPQRAAALEQSLEASVPSLSRRALR